MNYVIEYMAYWKKIAKEMLGWTEAQTETWAKKWSGVEDALGGNPPRWYLAEYLIPQTVLISPNVRERDELGSRVSRTKMVYGGVARNAVWHALSMEAKGVRDKRGG